MTQEDYEESRQKLEEMNAQLNDLKSKLSDCDSDYETLQKCKEKVATASAFLNNIVIQCKDVNKIFDRGTIEGKYDAHRVNFNNKDVVFSFLDNIVNSSDNFQEICEETIKKIDEYGDSLNDLCIKVANNATNISNDIRALSCQIDLIDKRINAFNGIPDSANIYLLNPDEGR